MVKHIYGFLVLFIKSASSFQLRAPISMIRTSASCVGAGSRQLSSLEWVPMEDTRDVSDSSNLCSPDKNHPRLAKDKEYADAVLHAWKEDTKSEKSKTTVGSILTYQRGDGTELNGYIVATSNLVENHEQSNANKVPVILFFHTGAGPQDVFLRWKADTLARSEIWGEHGCIVFIADIISDAQGWAWSDREKYSTSRQNVLTPFQEDGKIGRWKLRETINAALSTINGIDVVDSERVAALGWCLGGHSILELGLMREAGVRTLVSFHGVFDGIREQETQHDKLETGENNDFDVLICNGAADPFVAQDDIAKSKDTLESRGWRVNVLNFDQVRHGFTNPAQDFNPSEAFVFDKDAAKVSWDNTIELLQKKLM